MVHYTLELVRLIQRHVHMFLLMTCMFMAAARPQKYVTLPSLVVLLVLSRRDYINSTLEGTIAYHQQGTKIEYHSSIY